MEVKNISPMGSCCDMALTHLWLKLRSSSKYIYDWDGLEVLLCANVCARSSWKKILGSETMSKSPLLVEQGKASFTRCDYGQWHRWSKIGLADCRRKNLFTKAVTKIY